MIELDTAPAPDDVLSAWDSTQLDTLPFVLEELPKDDGLVAPGVDISAQTEAKALVAEALEQLTDRQRQVAVGIFMLGLSNKALADQLGISPQGVGQIKNQSLKKLQKYFGLAEPRQRL